MQEIFEAIPVRSELIVLINSGANPVYPSTVGTLHIARVHTFRETALFSDTYGNRWTAETKSGESSVLFVKWVPLPTAMPPEWQPITLAGGIGGAAQCCKTQEGVVYVKGWVTGVKSGIVFATLPPNYRSPDGFNTSLMASSAAVPNMVRLMVGADGTMMVDAVVDASRLATGLSVHFDFVAS